ncbi:beta-lactamase [Oceanicola sp. 22II-s10i]|uniref:N-acyl homoserine lactonase family protein n=1 Tax=Oceanicola sp. 22II-s10i TaxID=1317116 RepID=UPI000B527A88|nr:N-acyl homoserine lactonase family protein [Oceanicola sp. 22II-s10i]OWU83748.1 beta-lactamase [Oceanicola sp. 22II-s10i]
MNRFIAPLALTAATVLPGLAPAAETALWRLDCGSIEVRDLNLFSDTMAYPGQSMTLTNSCYAIRHGGEVMIWDTGFPAALIGAPASEDVLAPSLESDLPSQLAEIGIAPSDVTKVGISHYHFDHTGQAAAFAQAELLIGAADWTVLSGPLPDWAGGFVVPETLAPWVSGGARVRAVPGDHDVFGDGSVVMLAMPGHTPGETALLVNLPETGPVLLSGDVVHFAEQIDGNGVPGFNFDRADSLASMARMTTLADNLGAVLVVQHDPRHIDRLPAFPEAAR